MQIEEKHIRPVHQTVCAIGSTVFWYLFAHGYRFSNGLFSHDSLHGFYQADSAWEISLGRFMHPILIFLRGGISSPWLISCCTLLWLSLGIYLIVQMLGIKNLLSIIAVSGILVCNMPLTSLNSAFLQWVDFYAFSLLLSILGVWLFRKGSLLCTVLGAAVMAVSMGIYQAYICVSIVLFILLLLHDAQENAAWKGFLKNAFRCCGILLSAAILYYLTWKLFLGAFHIWTADTYNGMSSLDDYTEQSLFSIIILAYKKVLDFFVNPDTFITMTYHEASLSIIWKYILRCANATAVMVSLCQIIALNHKKNTRLWQRAFQTVLLLLLPMGMNFACIMAKGFSHSLMNYAFLFLYILAIDMTERRSAGCQYISLKPCLRTLVWLSALGVIWTGVVYANQTYLKKELQERAVTSLMTRIVSEIENTEGYIPEVTPVAFSGSFEASPCLQQLEGFEDLLPYGMGKTTLTYLGLDYAFLQYEMSLPMNYTRIDFADPAVSAMPSYPGKGSIAYVGDILVVKISDSL